MNKAMRSRKLWIFIIVSITGSAVWFLSDKSIFNDWVDFIKWMVGLYFMSNVGAGVAKAMKGKNGQKTQTEATA